MKTNETKMKVMISRPMNGISDSEVRRIQKELREKFAKCGIEVVDSFLTEEPDSEIRNPRPFRYSPGKSHLEVVKEYVIKEIIKGGFKMNIEKKVDIGKPAYYVEGRRYEPKDIIREFNFNFNLGCAVKYISRAGRKDPSKHVEDLEKALNYLRFEQSAIYNNIFNMTTNKPDAICTKKLNIDDEVAYYKMAKVSFDWNLSDELSLALMNLVSCQITNYNTFVYFYIEKAIGYIGDEISNIMSNDTPEGTV